MKRGFLRTMLLFTVILISLLSTGVVCALAEGGTEPLSAVITLDKSTIEVGETVTASWTLSGGRDAYVYYYYWIYVSGGSELYTSTIMNPAGSTASFTPSIGEKCRLYLYVKDAEGKSTSIYSNYVTITGAPPVEPLAAEITLDKTIITVGETITASWTLSGGRTPRVTSYYWHAVSDGLTADSSSVNNPAGNSASFTPAAGDKCRITLYLRDEDGRTGTFISDYVFLYEPVFSINAAMDHTTINVGESVQISASALPAKAMQTFTYTSLDPAVVTVNSAGVVKGIAAGSTSVKVQACDNSGVESVISVEVVNNPAFSKPRTFIHGVGISIVISGGVQRGISFTMGAQLGTAPYTYKITLLRNGTALYTNTTSVAGEKFISTGSSVPSGNYTILVQTTDAAGSCDVAQAYVTVNNTETSQEVIVSDQTNPLILVSSVDLGMADATVFLGDELHLTASVLPNDATDKGIVWSSSDASVADVTEDGLVSALKFGTAVITATAQDGSGKAASVTVQVTQPVEEITLNPAATVIYTGNTMAIDAAVLPENASDKTLVFTSSDPAVATVDASGVVTAIKPGSIEITATAQDGSQVSASCTIQILEFLSIISVESDYVGVNTGDTITWTTTATGGSGTKSYLFELFRDGELLDGGTYGDANTFSYTPTQAGIYYVCGYVRDSTGTVSMVSNGVIVDALLSILSVTADRESAEIGTPILWTATTSYGRGTKSYLFHLYKDWETLEVGTYGDAATFSYTPTAAGTYYVTCYVQDATGLALLPGDSVIVYAPLSISSVTANKTSVGTGSTITWTAAATGGNGTKSYLFELYKDGGLVDAGVYGASPTYSYTPTQAGTYKVCGYVRDSSGTVSKMSGNVIVYESLYNLSVTANKTSGATGSPITWTAAAMGGSGARTYQFKLYKGSSLLVTGSYGAAHTYSYTPSAAGTYSVLCYAKDSTGTVSLKSANVVIYTPLSMTSVKADKTSAYTRSAITWTAAAAGGSGTKTYQFKLYKGTEVLFTGNFGTTATYRYTPTAAGTYHVVCYVKDSTGTKSMKSASIVVKAALTITSVKADKTSAVIRTPITFTAAATGGSGTKTYQFKLYKGTQLLVTGKFGSASTYKYTPTAAGTYSVLCYVKDSSGTVSLKSADVLIYAPLAITSVKADKTSANTGTLITWTAAATGGNGAKTYQFKLYKGTALLSSGSFGAAATFRYTPTSAGTYSVLCYVKDSTGTVSMRSASVTVIVPLSITSVTADKAGSVIGSAITWKTTATGGSGTKTYQFKLYKGTQLLVTGKFGTANTFKYTPTSNGTYNVVCYVKDSSGTVSLKSANVIVAPLSITSVKADKTSAVIGTPITWTISAAGGSGAKTYQFKLYNGTQLLVTGAFGSANTFKYTPTSSGTYNVICYVKDSTGTVSMKSANVTVYAQLSISSVTADVTSAEVGTEITWTATATGGSGAKSYLFELYKDDELLDTGEYSDAKTFTYAPIEAGIYHVVCYVKDSTGTVSMNSGDVIVGEMLSIVSVDADTTSAEVGTEITWTITAIGGSGAKSYLFELYKDDELLDEGSYGENDTFTYLPTEEGTYHVVGYVKDDTDTVSMGSDDVIVYAPLSITSVEANHLSAEVGMELTWTITATGGSGAKSYLFELYKDDELLDEGSYGDNDTFTYLPTEGGTYHVVGYVKDDTDIVSRGSDDIIVDALLSILSVNASHTRAVIGTEITWTLVATGGRGSKSYCFDLFEDNDLLDSGTYGDAESYSYTPTEAGTYYVVGYVQDDGAMVGSTSDDVIIYAPLAITGVNADASSVDVGGEITWTISSDGGYGTKSYRFELYKDGGLLDSGSYGDDDTFTYMPTEEGIYHVVGYVKDDTDTVSLESSDVSVIAP